MNTQQPINTRTAWHPVLRPIGRLLIAAQLALVLQPLCVLAQDKGQAPFNPQAQAQLQRLGELNQRMEQAKALKANAARSPADRVSEKLARTEELVKGIRQDKDSRDARRGERRTQRLAELKEQLQSVEAGIVDVRSEFEATGQELRRKNLPTEIIQRHQQAQAEIEQRAAEYKTIAARLTKLQADEAAIEELDAFFKKYPASRKPAERDAKKLPWRTPSPNKRTPAETKAAWYRQLYADQHVQLAQAGGLTTIGGVRFSIPPEPGQAPTDADLAETDETRLTAAIRAKAAELQHNPVGIHNWVHSNIEYVPTAGAIQSAQDTLDKRRGNATDTASLLIALLRASGIPARYQWGTIDVPAEQAMNWTGGVTHAEAALQLLNQGGIAARGIASAGRIRTVRLEHVWVSAYVNWTPSRGSRDGGWDLSPKQHPNPNAQLNAWVPLDASYKQYNYSAGLNLQQAVPLDANALLAAALQGANVNEAEGWVQNLNQSAIQSQLTDYQTRLKSYIDSTPSGASSTVGDVIGRKLIPQRNWSLLAGTLAHPVVQLGAQASAIPAALQHQFRYELSHNGATLLSYAEKTSNLAGKRLTLSYIPASQTDADVIASYLPKPNADGSPIRADQLPTSLPAYLIRLKAQITLEGQVVATSNQAVQMGADLSATGGFTQLYDISQWDLTVDESNVAGQATVIGISAGGISVNQIEQLKARLTSMQTTLQTGNTASIATLSGEQISGDLLTAVIWSWFAAAESHSKLTQSAEGIVENAGLSYGLFHAVAQPEISWGVVRKVTFPGVNIDVGHMRNITWAKDNDVQKWIAFNRLRGQYMSALEHAVPERFLNDPNQCNLEGSASPVPGLPACPQGVSAVKALGVAAQAGQRIYTITRDVYQSNPNIVQTGLSAHSINTRNRVQDALDAGYEVTIHEAPVTISGWTGAGYTLIDPNTGAGGYLIEGGSNGGVLFWIGLVFLLAAIVLIAIALAPLIASSAAAIGAALAGSYVTFIAELALIRIGTLVVQGNLAAAALWSQRIDLLPLSERIRVFMQTFLSYIIQNPATDWAKRNFAQTVQEMLLK